MVESACAADVDTQPLGRVDIERVAADGKVDNVFRSATRLKLSRHVRETHHSIVVSDV